MNIYLFHANALSGESLFLEDGQGAEDVLFYHVDDQVEVWDDDRGHAVLVIEVVIELLQVSLPVVLLLDLLHVVVVVHWVRASL